MPYTVTYDSDNDLVILDIEDHVTFELIRKIAPIVSEKCKEHHCRRLLNNMSKSTIDVSLFEILISPKVITDAGMANIKRALVVPDSFTQSNYLLNATLSQGHDFMIFKNTEDATKWLLSEYLDK